MSCCNRPNVLPTPRWPGRSERGQVLPLAPSSPSPGVTRVGGKGQDLTPLPPLRFTGRFTLSLPLGTRRLLVRPGEVLDALAPGDAARLWRTGLFEAADPPRAGDGPAPGQDSASAL